MSIYKRILSSFTIVTYFLFVFTQADTILTKENGFGGQYMAFITNGDVDDFGYNYIINAGRTSMEQKLNITNTLWVPNVSKDEAYSTIVALVNQGYKFILSGTFVHKEAIKKAALQYKTVSFVSYSITPEDNIDNLSASSFLNSEYWWAVGVIAAITSSNSRLGFVAPKTGTNQSVNAFYSGAKYAEKNYPTNGEIVVYVMFSADFTAPDTTTRACEKLVNDIRVGSLTGQQDDLTLPRYAFDHGLMAIGVTGYPLRSLWGGSVGLSLIRDWTDTLVYFGQRFLTDVDNVTSTKGFFRGGFSNGGQDISDKSFLVTDDQWGYMKDAIEKVKNKNANGSYEYLCGEYLQKFTNYSPLTTCLPSLDSDYNNRIYPDIYNLGESIIPLTDIALSQASRIGIIVAACFLTLIPIGLIFFFFFKLRLNPQMQSESLFFLMLLGSILVYMGAVVWPLAPNPVRCNARIWLPSIGATMTISVLITKNFRIFLLFFNSFLFRGKRLSTLYYTPFVALAVIIDLVLLILFTTKGYAGVDYEQGKNGLGPYEQRLKCLSHPAGDGIIIGILVCHLIQLLGCVISFMLRNVTERQYNEKNSAAVSIYTGTFCLIIVSVLIGVTNVAYENRIILISSSLIIANTGLLIIVFGSTVVSAFIKPVEGIVIPQAKLGSSTHSLEHSRSLSKVSGEESAMELDDSPSQRTTSISFSPPPSPIITVDLSSSV